MHVKCSRLCEFLELYDEILKFTQNEILSSFTQPRVVLNLYEFLCHLNIKKIFWRMFIIRRFLVPIDSNSVFIFLFFFFHTMKVMQQLFGYQYCSQYILLRSTAEGNSYRLRKTTEFFIFFGELFLESSLILLLLPERKSLHVLDWITFVK